MYFKDLQSIHQEELLRHQVERMRREHGLEFPSTNHLFFFLLKYKQLQCLKSRQQPVSLVKDQLSQMELSNRVASMAQKERRLFLDLLAALFHLHASALHFQSHRQMDLYVAQRHALLKSKEHS